MDYFKAFITGGLICIIGQLLIDKTKLTPARILVSFVVAGVFLELIGIYEPIARRRRNRTSHRIWTNIMQKRRKSSFRKRMAWDFYRWNYGCCCRNIGSSCIWIYRIFNI